LQSKTKDILKTLRIPRHFLFANIDSSFVNILFLLYILFSVCLNVISIPELQQYTQKNNINVHQIGYQKRITKYLKFLSEWRYEITKTNKLLFESDIQILIFQNMCMYQIKTNQVNLLLYLLTPEVLSLLAKKAQNY